MTTRKTPPLDFSSAVETDEPLLLDAPAAPALAAEPALSGADAWTVDRAPDLEGPARRAYWFALLVPLFWGASLWAFVVGLQQPVGAMRLLPVQVAVILALSLTPVGVALFAAYVVRQGARLAAEARRTQSLAELLASPALLAAAETNRAAELVIADVDAAQKAARSARQELLALRKALLGGSKALVEAAERATHAGEGLRQSLGVEREQFEALSAHLSEQTAAVEQVLGRQVALVTDASRLAQAQLGEAEAALTARAADLTRSAAGAAEAGQVAAEQLGVQADRLQEAGATATARMHEIETGLDEQRNALALAASALLEEHEHRAAETETQRARLEKASALARAQASQAAEQSALSAEGLRDLLEAVSAQLAVVSAAAQERRAELEGAAEAALAKVAAAATLQHRNVEAQAGRSLAALVAGAAEAEQSAERYAGAAAERLEALKLTIAGVEETAARALNDRVDGARTALEALHGAAATASGAVEQAAERHTEAARKRLEDLRSTVAEVEEVAARAMDERVEGARAAVDALTHAAVAASGQADRQVDEKVEAVRRLIAETSVLVDEVGERTTARIGGGVAEARSALTDLQASFEALESRLSQLPDHAREQAAAVNSALEEGLADVTGAAKRALAETETLDAAFQARVADHQARLGEALRLVGAGATTPSAEPPIPAAPAMAAPEIVVPAPPQPPRRPEPAAVEPTSPIASDEEFQALFEAAGGRISSDLPKRAAIEDDDELFEGDAGPVEVGDADAAGGEWTWKSLLTAMQEAQLDGRALTERMVGEVVAMGVDASALLPRAEVESLVAVLQSGDARAVRRVVKRLAPSAVRRLARRITTDEQLSGQVERYAHGYGVLLDEAARRDRSGGAAAALLGSDSGRAYLLLDAAADEARAA